MNGATQILVARWSADPIELTALATLRRELGFGAALEALKRRVLWELRSDEEPGDIDEVLDHLRLSGEIWNPNKETSHIRRPGEAVAALGEPFGSPGEWVVIAAWNPERDEDRSPHAVAVLRRQGWHLSRATIWCMRWSSIDPAERLRLSMRAAVCKSGKEGLLVHPHLETWRVVGAGDAPPWIRAADSGPLRVRSGS